jgi:hypothetical protein
MIRNNSIGIHASLMFPESIRRLGELMVRFFNAFLFRNGNGKQKIQNLTFDINRQMLVQVAVPFLYLRGSIFHPNDFTLRMMIPFDGKMLVKNSVQPGHAGIVDADKTRRIIFEVRPANQIASPNPFYEEITIRAAQLEMEEAIEVIVLHFDNDGLVGSSKGKVRYSDADSAG